MNNYRYNWVSSPSWNRGGYNRGGRGGRRNFRGQPYGNFGGRGFQQNNYGRNEQPWNKFKRDVPAKRLSEKDIGITEYVSEHEGFLGVIKSRYSDFQVSEINEQGEVAQLTSLTPPDPPSEQCIDEDEDLLLSKYNVEILPMETWDRINSLAISNGPTDENVEVDVAGMSKEQRTKIHDAVKKAFGDAIVGSTVTVDDKKFVRFQKYRKGVRIDKRVKWMWPGEYTHFIVHKENCDTMDAAIKIAERLRLNLKPSMLGYAGTKDRRAKTSQWFSARKVDPRKIAAACRDLRDIHVGNYTFSARHLKLGMLKGNKFRIALRNVTAADDSIATACGNLRALGFLNYYGLQRFGTRADVPTYRVGRALHNADLRQAIADILSAREGPLAACLRAYAVGGAECALRAVPRHAAGAIEVRLLRALATHPNDLHGAIHKLPRNTRLLYLHAYQSWVWNRAVSQRVRTLGLAPAAGDLVVDATHVEKLQEEEDGDHTDTEENEEGEEDAEQAKEAEKPKEKPKKEEAKPKVPVKVLTQEDVDSKKYTIMNVVMPLPGYNIEYPPNMRDFYQQLLARDNLKLEMKNKIKEYSMSGAYRPIVVCPLELEWECVRYSDPLLDLIPSDLDLLNGLTPHSHPDGKYKALLLTLTLPASCYATMALRELLKVDTSGDNQALQNNYHKVKDNKSENDTLEKDTLDKEDGEKDHNNDQDKETGNDTEDLKAVMDSESALEDNGNVASGKRKLECEGEGAEKKSKIDESDE